MKKCVEDYVELTIENRTIKISLYKLSNSPNYYYYFRHKGEKFQSSCKSSDLARVATQNPPPVAT